MSIRVRVCVYLRVSVCFCVSTERQSKRLERSRKAREKERAGERESVGKRAGERESVGKRQSEGKRRNDKHRVRVHTCLARESETGRKCRKCRKCETGGEDTTMILHFDFWLLTGSVSAVLVCLSLNRFLSLSTPLYLFFCGVCLVCRKGNLLTRVVCRILNRAMLTRSSSSSPACPGMVCASRMSCYS